LLDVFARRFGAGVALASGLWALLFPQLGGLGHGSSPEEFEQRYAAAAALGSTHALFNLGNARRHKAVCASLLLSLMSALWGTPLLGPQNELDAWSLKTRN